MNYPDTTNEIFTKHGFGLSTELFNELCTLSDNLNIDLLERSYGQETMLLMLKIEFYLLKNKKPVINWNAEECDKLARSIGYEASLVSSFVNKAAHPKVNAFMLRNDQLSSTRLMLIYFRDELARIKILTERQANIKKKKSANQND